MEDQSLEHLWRSLLNDGLAGIFDRSFDSRGLSGLLAGLPAIAEQNGNGLNLRGLAGIAPAAGTAGQGVLPQLLHSVPLAGGLLRHFLEGEPTERATVAPIRYQSPERIELQADLPSATSAVANANGQTWSGAAPVSANPTVLIQVNAMDSMSILDRSDDIAKAVRQAMLTYQPFDDIWR